MYVLCMYFWFLSYCVGFPTTLIEWAVPNSIKVALAIGHWQLNIRHLGIRNTLQCFAWVTSNNSFPRINEWFTSKRIPIYAQRILESLGGKHDKSLERNVWRKVVFSSKAVNLDKLNNAFSHSLFPLYTNHSKKALVFVHIHCFWRRNSFTPYISF